MRVLVAKSYGLKTGDSRHTMMPCAALWRYPGFAAFNSYAFGFSAVAVMFKATMPEVRDDSTDLTASANYYSLSSIIPSRPGTIGTECSTGWSKVRKCHL